MPSGDSRTLLHIDLAAECIWRDREKIGIPPKAFLVLRRLMERPGQLVTKNELLEAVWPNTFVTERVLNNAIGCLREALGDDRRRPRFIETVHRRGFRWIGEVQERASGAGGAEVETPLPPDPCPPTTSFVGRADSLAELSRCLARAHAGQRQLVLVTGEPGIGKSALVDHFLHGPAPGPPPAPALLARGQCIDSHGAVDLYRPLREAVERLLIGGGDVTRAIFRQHAPSWLLSLPALSSPAELEALRRSAIASTGESVQRELERAIEATSVARTVVLVLEDLHWSEPATVALLWALATRPEPARLLVIGTYRSVEATIQQHPIIRLKRELAAKRQCLELTLEGLPTDTVSTFLDRHYQQHRLSAEFAARLYEETAGNPLFLLNALADFERRGWLQQQEGTWECNVDLDAIANAVPESTRELIGFRLDQLPPLAQELLEAASIAGDTFTTQAVAAASERDCGEVETELEPLARTAFFLEKGPDVEWPDGTRGCQHRFRHALYRQVLTRRITPTRRQLLHRRIALALEGSHGDRVGEIADALSRHHEEAGDALRAVDYIDMLVQQAYARSASYEAEVLLGHAVQLLKRTRPSRARDERLLRVTIAHAAVLSTTRGMTSVESLRALEDARALGQSVSTSLEQIASMGTMVSGKIARGQLREARNLAGEMVALIGESESSAEVVTAYASVGSSSLFLGEVDAAVRNLERSVANIDVTSPATTGSPMPSFEPLVPAFVFLGLSWGIAGYPEKGRTAIGSALQLARSSDIPWYLGFTLNQAGLLALVRRDRSATRQLASVLFAYAAEKDLPVWKIANELRLGWVDVLESRDSTRIAPLREMADSFRTTGIVMVSHGYCLLTEACLSVGRIDEAADALDIAFDTRGEERIWEVERFRLRGAISRARAQTKGRKSSAMGDAEQCFEQAIAIAKTQGTRLFGLRATVDLCRLWLTAGKRHQAYSRLGENLGQFDEGFDETDLREARALLDELG